jgi:hypothetical protein
MMLFLYGIGVILEFINALVNNTKTTKTSQAGSFDLTFYGFD